MGGTLKLFKLSHGRLVCSQSDQRVPFYVILFFRICLACSSPTVTVEKVTWFLGETRTVKQWTESQHLNATCELCNLGQDTALSDPPFPCL